MVYRRLYKEMQIDFFDTETGMDNRAVKGGVYQIDLINVETNKSVCLYIGESVWIASRCGLHLYSIFEEPEYLGLKKDDLDNDKLTLKFSVISEIIEKKSILGVGKYKEQELKAIIENRPLTQLQTSDRQIRNIDEKVEIVQREMKCNGLK